MKVGDLVAYIGDGGFIGIVVEYDFLHGCYSVQWNDGSYDEDLVYGELEAICK